VPRQGEATAIVDGQLLKVGGKLGSYEVTHIDAHGLMVRGPSGRERWTLAGVEVLDSRQSPGSLKMGPLGDVRKPARRPAGVEAVPVFSDMPTRAPGAAAPSPLVFPLPAPQGQPVPVPRPAQPPEQAPQTAPVPIGPARPALKQALTEATPWAHAAVPLPAAAPMTVAFQPAVRAMPRAPVPPKRGTNSQKTWTAAAPQQALRMDLDDMRRIVQLLPTSTKPSASIAASTRWQRPVGPNPYGAWLAAWATGPALTQRPSMAFAESGLVLARWQPPKASPARLSTARYSPVQGPRPMPASVVWRQATAAKAWQPQGGNELPGAHTSQWASAATPPLRIAALEAKPSAPRHFAPAVAKPLPRTWAPTRWAQGRTGPTAVAAAPVSHSYPMAMPNWRSSPPVAADNSSLTQVAYALETP
jgi:hypothetical protein